MLKNLEELRDLFEDTKLHLVVAKVEALHLADDKSFLKVTVSVYPEIREIVARMTWDAVGPDSGFYAFPSPGDLVIVGMAEGDDDQAYMLKRLSSQEDTIPLRATEGHSLLKSLASKHVWLTSDTKINLSKGDTLPTQNLVLGQVFKTFMTDLLKEIDDLIIEMKKETHTGNLGFATDFPINKTQYEAIRVKIAALKADPIANSKILSDLAFTEK